MKINQNILIVGVGGQGILLTSEMLSCVAMKAGYDVKKSEVHGMAQRGGVVSSHVRFGKKIHSPLIPLGQADIIMAFEAMEAIRWIHFLDRNGKLVVNQQNLVPPIAASKGLEYPKDIMQRLQKTLNQSRILIIDALTIVDRLQNQRVVNMILLGALSNLLKIPSKIWENTIMEKVPKGTVDINLAAFQEGQLFIDNHD